MTYTELIIRRVSVRTYRKTGLSPEVEERIGEAAARLTKGPFGTPVRFMLLPAPATAHAGGLRFGTYGMISGAPAYLAGAAELLPSAMEDFGYCMERIILDLTAMGLGTCWLGGTFTRGGFAEAVRLAEGEVLPAVTPVGYPVPRQRLLDRLVRTAAGSKNRKPWGQLFFRSEGARLLPLEGPSETRPDRLSGFDAALAAVRLAPSASNRQPWRLVRAESGEAWHLYCRPTPGYGNFGPHIRLQRIDMGICMCHLELAAFEAGCPGTWARRRPVPSPGGMEYIATYTLTADNRNF